MSQYNPKLVRFYMNINVCISFGGHNIDTFLG